MTDLGALLALDLQAGDDAALEGLQAAVGRVVRGRPLLPDQGDLPVSVVREGSLVVPGILLDVLRQALRPGVSGFRVVGEQPDVPDARLCVRDDEDAALARIEDAVLRFRRRIAGASD